MGHQISIAVFKTLLGSWATSRRVQKEVQPCIFCNLPASDTLQHYVGCDMLWHSIHTVLPFFCPSFDPLSVGAPASCMECTWHFTGTIPCAILP
eukprot:7744596-Karenia_brevis.AAC.1